MLGGLALAIRCYASRVGIWAPRADVALAFTPSDVLSRGGRVCSDRGGARARGEEAAGRREIGNLLPNNQRQRRTCYALCHILYPVSAAHTSIFRMDSNSTSYGWEEGAFDVEGALDVEAWRPVCFRYGSCVRALGLAALHHGRRCQFRLSCNRIRGNPLQGYLAHKKQPPPLGPP